MIDPTFNMMLRLLRGLGKRSIMAQLRGTELPSTLPNLRGHLIESLGIKIESSFPEDRYALSPNVIERQGYTWCFYPMPETEVFLRGLPRWCFCLAGYLRGQLHKALVFEPHTGNYYVARLKGGAYEKTRRIRFAANRDLAQALLTLHSPLLARQGQRLVGATGSMINSGSWLLDLLDCAAGRLDIFYGTSLQPELVQIAALFVSEIGGLAADEQGRPLPADANSLLATNTYLFDQARPLLLNEP